MPLRGHWVPAKRMALALHALIEGRYPNDTLYLVGFSDYARRMQPEDLTGAGLERVYGTNMQHAFNLAGRLLAQHPRATKQVIMVTDGEPTAHLVGEQAYFNWPPVPETIRLTLQEAMRLSKAGVTINVFMLEDTPGLQRFMERLARLTNGRIFQTAGVGEGLGEFVVRDFVSPPRRLAAGCRRRCRSRRRSPGSAGRRRRAGRTASVPSRRRRPASRPGTARAGRRRRTSVGASRRRPPRSPSTPAARPGAGRRTPPAARRGGSRPGASHWKPAGSAAALAPFG